MTQEYPNAAHRVIETLLMWGVRDVFICPGSTEAPFLDATVDYPELKLWTTTHEVTAVAMADGYARATARPAVAFLHTAVGLANGVGGLYTALIGRVPLLVMTGTKSLAIQSRRGFTAGPHIEDLPRAHTKWEWQSLTSEEIVNDVDRALQVASTRPWGPVWLGLPEDLLAASAPTGPNASGPIRRGVGDVVAAPEEIARAAELLSAAVRPVLVAGSDLARDEGSQSVAELAETLGAMIFHEDRRAFERTVVATNHPAYAGLYSTDHPLVRDADVIAFLGARCFHEFESRRSSAPPPGALIIQGNTDPFEIGKTYGVDVGLPGHQGKVAASLVEQVRKRVSRSRTVPPVEYTEPARTRIHGEESSLPNVDEVARRIGPHIGPDVTTVVDATTSNAAMVRLLPQTHESQLLASSAGALGWGVGAAMGVQAARPEKKVLCVLGDGSFQFGMQGLSVAAREQLPVLFLVVNNSSFAAVAAGLHRYAGRAVETGHFPGVDISGTHVADIAAGYGLRSRRVSTLTDFDTALDELMPLRAPALIEIMTDPRDLGPT